MLFGGSNIGGAVKYVSKRPELGSTNTKIKYLAGGQAIQDLELSTNISLSDDWAELFCF